LGGKKLNPKVLDEHLIVVVLLTDVTGELDAAFEFLMSLLLSSIDTWMENQERGGRFSKR